MGTDSGIRNAKRLLDREGLLRVLDALSQRLGELGLRANIHLAGGACMILAHQRTRATLDVDSLFIDERESVLRAAREVAKEHGLSEEWLNDDVRDLYFQTSMSFQTNEAAPALYDSPALVVTGASLGHMLAMKAQACRNSDLDDISFLLRRLNVTTMDEIREVHESVFPYESLSPEKERRLETILRQVLDDGRVDQSVPFRSIRLRHQRRSRKVGP